jgi:mono/diheme cytochrome c family protein
MKIYGLVSSTVCTLVLVSALTSVPARASTEDQAQEPGKAAFKSSCSTCHGADGAGHTATGKALQIPDLRSADAQKLTDDQVAEIINKGKAGRMPAFAAKLDNEQVQLLVKFIRKLAQDSKAGDGR